MPCPMGNGPAVFRRLTVRIPRRWSGMRRRDACSTSAQADTHLRLPLEQRELATRAAIEQDRKSTRLNSSHVEISYAVFCLKKKKKKNNKQNKKTKKKKKKEKTKTKNTK